MGSDETWGARCYRLTIAAFGITLTSPSTSLGTSTTTMSSGKTCDGRKLHGSGCLGSQLESRFSSEPRLDGSDRAFIHAVDLAGRPLAESGREVREWRGLISHLGNLFGSYGSSSWSMSTKRPYFSRHCVLVSVQYLFVKIMIWLMPPTAANV